MKKDIPDLKVKSVAVAIVPDTNIPGDESGESWIVFLINLNNHPLLNVIITAQGYGEIAGENRKTSTLRYVIETLPAQSFARIEPIMSDVLGLTNEYWISYYHEGQLYDKRYIFLPETIKRDNMTPLPLMETKGILII